MSFLAHQKQHLNLRHTERTLFCFFGQLLEMRCIAGRSPGNAYTMIWKESQHCVAVLFTYPKTFTKFLFNCFAWLLQHNLPMRNTLLNFGNLSITGMKYWLATAQFLMFKKSQKSPLLFEGRWNAVSQRLINLHFIIINV